MCRCAEYPMMMNFTANIETPRLASLILLVKPPTLSHCTRDNTNTDQTISTTIATIATTKAITLMFSVFCSANISCDTPRCYTLCPQLITTYEVANLEKRPLQNIAWRYLIIDEAHR